MYSNGVERASVAKTRSDTTKQAPPKTVTVDYIKSNSFRVVHADGIFGGLTPSLDIHIDIWSHRQPIPQRSIYKVTEDGKLGSELQDERIVRADFVREVEVGVVLDANVAKSLIKWLQDKVKQVEKAQRQFSKPKRTSRSK